jgi:hypothetical protein
MTPLAKRLRTEPGAPNFDPGRRRIVLKRADIVDFKIDAHPFASPIVALPILHEYSFGNTSPQQPCSCL